MNMKDPQIIQEVMPHARKAAAKPLVIFIRLVSQYLSSQELATKLREVMTSYQKEREELAHQGNCTTECALYIVCKLYFSSIIMS